MWVSLDDHVKTWLVSLDSRIHNAHAEAYIQHGGGAATADVCGMRVL